MARRHRRALGHGHAPQTVAIEPLSIARVRRPSNRQQVQERGHSFFVPYLTQRMRWYNVARNWHFEDGCLLSLAPLVRDRGIVGNTPLLGGCSLRVGRLSLWGGSAAETLSP